MQHSFMKVTVLIILKAADCDAVRMVLRYTDGCFYYFVHPIFFNEGGLKNRNTSLYNATDSQRCYDNKIR